MSTKHIIFAIVGYEVVAYVCNNFVPVLPQLPFDMLSNFLPAGPQACTQTTK